MVRGAEVGREGAGLGAAGEVITAVGRVAADGAVGVPDAPDELGDATTVAAGEARVGALLGPEEEVAAPIAESVGWVWIAATVGVGAGLEFEQEIARATSTGTRRASGNLNFIKVVSFHEIGAGPRRASALRCTQSPAPLSILRPQPIAHPGLPVDSGKPASVKSRQIVRMVARTRGSECHTL